MMNIVRYGKWEISPDTLNDFVDVTVSDKALSWTYCKTHESMCGPYFCKK